MTSVRAECRAVAAAVMYFTRLPVPARLGYDPSDLLRAPTYLPLIGWLVGGVAALTWWLASRVWPPELASGVSLAATLLLTGALHEDGVADVCDGFGASAERERVLAIMRDSRVGAFGVAGLVVMLGLKWQAVASLPALFVPAVLVAGHTVSRAAAASLMATLPYVRDEGKARALAAPLSFRRLAVVVATALVPLVLLPAHAAWTGLAVVVAIRGWLARWFGRRLGGYTGDCLGAAQQITELVFYLTVLARV